MMTKHKSWMRNAFVDSSMVVTLSSYESDDPTLIYWDWDPSGQIQLDKTTNVHLDLKNGL